MKTQTPPTRLARRTKKEKKQIIFRRTLAVILMILAACLIWRFRTPAKEESDNPLPDVVPEWVERSILEVNPYSRPGTPLDAVNGVVIHYVGNPGTTALQNWHYYEGLATTQETSVSSHFLIDLDGHTIQCVPLNEVAYCSNTRNSDTLSIECCHLDDTGEFTPETEKALMELVQWLCDTYNLSRDQVIRHYDITGKECPRYYVQYPEAWEAFLDGISFSA